MSQPHPMDDFDPATEAALAHWAQEGWRRSKGVHIALDLGGSFSLSFGGNGRWTLRAMGNVGTDCAVAFAVQGILRLFGSKGFDSWAFILTLALASGLGLALSGTRSAWNRARLEGSSRIAALSMCLRRARFAIEGRPPNLWMLAYVVLGLASILLDKLSNVAPARTAQWLGARAQSAASLAGSAEIAMERAMRRNQALLSLARSFEEPSKVALDAYRSINDARVRCRWGIARRPGPGPAGPLPAAEGEMLRLHRAWIQEAFDSFEGLRSALDEARAAGAPAWLRPMPELPSLARMARATFERLEASTPDDPGDELRLLLDGFEARELAHELATACAPAATAPPNTPRL